VALTDTFVKNVKPGGSAAGEKHTDGQGLYLHVKLAGKYWRISYRYTAKREEKLAKVNAAGNTFKSIAQEWHAMKVKSSGAATTSEKRLTQMKNHIFPAIGRANPSPLRLRLPGGLLEQRGVVIREPLGNLPEERRCDRDGFVHFLRLHLEA